MTLGANTIIDVRSTGSDTLNGGMFDPGQTAGMFADGAATSATGDSPVFTSASYNFVAGDAGAWLYVASGTNWTPGWYQIASVAANAATLTAAIGTAYLALSNKLPTKFNTVAGCATTASPTGATWSIDYSQQNAAQFAYTDLASAGAGLTVSSAANPFAAQQVGNAIVITGGTNFTAGRYVIASVAAGVATVVGAANITTGAGASGTGGLGGALATPGQAGAHKVAGTSVFCKAATYTISPNTANVSGGKVSDTTGGVSMINPSWWVGWNTSRHTNCPDTTWPVLQTGLVAGTFYSIFATSAGYLRVRNWTADGLSRSGTTGFAFSGGGSRMVADHILATGCLNGGINQSTFQCQVWYSKATACDVGFVIGAGAGPVSTFYCESYANTSHGFSNQTTSASFVGCIASANGGRGFTGVAATYDRCVSYGNTSDGFDLSTTTASVLCLNCIAYGNGVEGWKTGAVKGMHALVNCAGGSNTSGDYTAANITDVTGFVSLSGNPFTNAGSGDFSLDNTTGEGAACRAAGFPGLMPRGTTTSYPDIGAAQHADPAASGGIPNAARITQNIGTY